MKIYFIYALKKGGKIFYIGYSANINRRLIEHKTTFGKDIEMEILEQKMCSRLEAYELEQKWIKEYSLMQVEIINKNLPIKTEKCLECKKEIIQTSGKRKRQFCNSSCRSLFWQKQQKVKKESVIEKILPIVQAQLETSVKINSLMNRERPVKMEGEDSFEYSFRVNEWKKSLTTKQ